MSNCFVKCCEKIASQVSFIKRADITLPLQVRLEREFINRSVHSSTWIEGNRLSFDQVVALAANKNVIAEEDQKREVNNCIKAVKWILQNRDKNLTEKRLLRLHEMMTNGMLAESKCGKYRHVQNYVVNSRNVVVCTPPAPGKVAQRMSSLLNWVKKSQENHPIVINAIFHHEFVTIHPFVDGNGRVARVASQWLLFEKGYDPLYTLGLDDFFAADRGRYYDMIQQTRDMDGDYTYWIDYVAEGLLDSVHEVSRRLKMVKRTKAAKKMRLTPKQEELLNLLSGHGIMGSAQICEYMQINRARVNQLIAPLVKCGIVVKEGTTRAVKYSLA
ncbi:MAG: Fic family protein [Candidatus Omnitrophica bacterium]|nr:Fic family protein [Candidatus Omnitrophota bacterium]